MSLSCPQCFPLQPPNNSNIWCNCSNLYGILCLVRLCWTDADIPCSPLHYDWYLSNWVAVTLLCPCWTSRPDWSPLLSESLGPEGDSWQRTEKQQRHIKEHQLGSSEAFMIPVVFWESQKKNKNNNKKHNKQLTSFTPSFIFCNFNLAAASSRRLDRDVIHCIYAAPPFCASHRCLWVSHRATLIQLCTRWPNPVCVFHLCHPNWIVMWSICMN